MATTCPWCGGTCAKTRDSHGAVEWRCLRCGTHHTRKDGEPDTIYYLHPETIEKAFGPHPDALPPLDWDNPPPGAAAG